MKLPLMMVGADAELWDADRNEFGECELNALWLTSEEREIIQQCSFMPPWLAAKLDALTVNPAIEARFR